MELKIQAFSRILPRMRQFPCWGDMAHRPSSTGLHVRVFDGLRGAAALAVVSVHSIHVTPDITALGVWMFFALSGFLLVQPFYSRPDVVYTRRGISAYFSRRLYRILPMYYLAVLIWCAMLLASIPHPLKWLVAHIVFIRSDGVLWTVKQELLFYLFLPIIMWAIRSFSPEGPGRSACLLVLSWLYYSYCNVHVISSTFWQPGSHVAVYANLFILGMAGGSFIHTRAARRLSTMRHAVATGNILSLTLLVLLLYYFFYSPDIPFVSEDGLGFNWVHSQVLGLLDAALLVSLVLFPQRNAVRGLFSLPPLRAIGVVGYSFYLLQMAVISCVRSFHPYSPNESLIGNTGLFLGVVVLLYAVSCVTYCLIERPLMARAPRARA